MGDTGRYPYGPASARRGALLRAADRPVARRRGRRQADRGGVQHRVGRRPRRPARRRSTSPWSGSSTPACGRWPRPPATDAWGWWGRWAPSAPARTSAPSRRCPCRSSSCPPRAPVSSSSWNEARRARTRWRCWPSACSRPCATPGSTPCCWDARTTPSWPGPSPMSWAATWCSCRRPTRRPSRCAPSSRCGAAPRPRRRRHRPRRRGPEGRAGRDVARVLVGRRGLVPRPWAAGSSARSSAPSRPCRGPSRPPVADGAPSSQPAPGRPGAASG